METDVQEIQREAAWVLSNATSKGNYKDVQVIIEWGVLKTFVHLLDHDDPKLLTVILEGINNILEKGKLINKLENPFVPQLEELEAVPSIEAL